MSIRGLFFLALFCPFVVQAASGQPFAPPDVSLRLFVPSDRGQAPGAGFLLRGGELEAAFEPSGVTLGGQGVSIRLRFLNGNPAPVLEGSGPVAASVNVLAGADAHYWKTGLPGYRAIAYRELYPGIDLVYDVRKPHLKSEFRVAPGGDPGRIRFVYEDSKPRFHSDGSLIMATAAGEFREKAPEIYQEREGQRIPVKGGYRLYFDGSVGFAIGPYDPSLELIIDPEITYSSYVGGSRFESITAVTADSNGNSYIAGWAESSDLPVTKPWQAMHRGSVDAFVAKVSPAGTLLYLTYLGGRGDDRALGIASGPSGTVYVAGRTASSDFPTASAAQPALAGGRDAFVVQLSAAGDAIIYSTYLGGSGQDSARSIAIDAAGNAYVTGETTSANFRVVEAYQSQNRGGQDAFLTKFGPSGNIVFSTYLGGAADDSAAAVAVNASGNAHVAGSTYSWNFPTQNPLRPSNGGGEDAFITKFSANGSALVYSTYLGGSGGYSGAPESAAGIAVDVNGNVYVTGTTSSTDFPVASPLRGILAGGVTDAFVAKLNATGSALLYSTYLGGSSVDAGTAITVNASGVAYVTGYTGSPDFPVAQPIQSTLAGSYDVFLVAMNANGSGLLFGTYLGGRGSDSGLALAFDGVESIYLAGQTLSYDFPLLNPLQASNYDMYAGFLTKVRLSQLQPPAAVSVSPSSGSGFTQTFSFVFTHPEGGNDIRRVEIIFNTTNTGYGGCSVVYDRTANRFDLANDQNTGYVTPSGSGSLENSRCLVRPEASSATVSGETLTVQLAATFRSAFGGTKNIYMRALDQRNLDSGWLTAGTWAVPFSNTPPTAGPVFPSSGSGDSQTFAITFSDVNGYSDLFLTEILINATLTSYKGCHILFDPKQRLLYLVNDLATANSAPIVLGSEATVENSQCILIAQNSSMTASGGTATLNIAVSFKAPFNGNKNIYARAHDDAKAASGWETLGVWAVTVTVPNHPPTVGPVSPSSGSGATQHFTFNYADPDGFADLSTVEILINAGLTNVNGCYILYDVHQNVIYLHNDAGTAPVAPGSGVLENSQCTLHASSSSASVSGSSLILSLALSFKPVFVGPKQVHLRAHDRAGVVAGWTNAGTWTVTQTANKAPSAGTVMPSLGSGQAQIFAFNFSDPNGGTDISRAEVIFNRIQSGFRSCYVIFEPKMGLLYLVNDLATGTSGGVALGSSFILENSQCSVSARNSSMTVSGQTATLRLSVTFKPAFAGARRIYIRAIDMAGLDSGWKQTGEWIVP